MTKREEFYLLKLGEYLLGQISELKNDFNLWKEENEEDVKDLSEEKQKEIFRNTIQKDTEEFLNLDENKIGCLFLTFDKYREEHMNAFKFYHSAITDKSEEGVSAIPKIVVFKYELKNHLPFSKVGTLSFTENFIKATVDTFRRSLTTKLGISRDSEIRFIAYTLEKIEKEEEEFEKDFNENCGEN